MAADGSIIIDVGLGTKKLATDMNSTIASAKKFSVSYASAISGSGKAVDQLTQKLARQNEQLAKQEAVIQRTEDRRSQSMAKYSADIEKQEALVERLQSRISSVETTGNERNALEEELKRAEAAAESLRAKYDQITQDRLKLKQLIESGSLNEVDQGRAEYTFEHLNKQGWPVLRQLEQAQAQAGVLKEELAQLKVDPNTNKLQELQDKLADATNKLGNLRQASVNAGASFDRDLGLGADKLQRLRDEAAATEQKLEQVQRQPHGIRGAFDLLSRAAENFSSALAKSASKGISLFKSLGARLSDILKRTNKSSSAFNRLGKRMLNLALAALVFNQIRKALRELTDYLGTAMRTNQQFVSSLASIKGNLLTAFQPIFEAIMPALNALMSALARVTAYIAAFVNLLFGKSVKASQASAGALYDQTKALQGVGGAAKKAAGALAAFDEINVLSQQDAGGGGGGNEVAPDFDFDYSALDEWYDRMSGTLDRILDVFRKAWANVGDYFLGGWQHALENVRELAGKIRDTLLEVWTDGHGQAFLESLLTLLGTMLYIIGDIAGAFSKAWDVAGYDVIASIFEMLTSIFDLLDSIGLAFRDIWNDGVGVTIATNLLQIFSNINYAISELAQRLHEAWESNENGQRIWTVILGIVDDLTSAVNRMSRAFLEWAKGLNLEPLISGFGQLLNAIRPLANMAFTGLEWAYKNVLLPFGKWLAELAFPVALDVITTAFETLYSILKSAQPSLEAVWNNFLLPLASWTGDVILDALMTLSELLGHIGDWINENMPLFESMGQNISEMAAKFWELIEPLASTVWATIKDLLVQISTGVGTLTAKLTPLIESIVKFASALYDVLEKSGFLEDKLNNLGAAWEVLKTIVQTVIDVIVLQIGTFMEQLQYLLDFFTNIFTGDFEAAFDSLLQGQEAFKKNMMGIWTSIGNGIIDIIEVAINWVIDKLNSISFEIPDFVPVWGGKKFSLNIPSVSIPKIQVPALATGAVLPPNQPFMAMVGDQRHGTNIEAPLSMIQQAAQDAVRAEMSGLVPLLEELIETVRNKDTATYLDSQAIYDGQQRVARQRGVSMVST